MVEPSIPWRFGEVRWLLLLAVLVLPHCSAKRDQNDLDLSQETVARDAEIAVQLEELRRQETFLLDSYGWSERKEGLARIPLDRAIELYLETGLVSKPPTATSNDEDGEEVATQP